MSEPTSPFRDFGRAALGGLAEGPARLVFDEWRRFLGENAHLTRSLCQTVRGAMRAAAEETLQARDAHVTHLEQRLAHLEAELARVRAADGSNPPTE